MEPLNSGSKLEDEAEVAAVVADLPLNARMAEPWLLEANNLLRGKALHSQTCEERALAAQYCARFAAKKIESTKVQDEASQKACTDAANWILQEADVLGPVKRRQMRHSLIRPAYEDGENGEFETVDLDRIKKAKLEFPEDGPTRAASDDVSPSETGIDEPVRYARSVDDQRPLPPKLVFTVSADGEDEDPANAMLAMANRYLKDAETAAEAGKKQKANLEFHSVFVYLEVVRAVKGGLDEATEQVQEYALWRSHQSGHLRFNSVHEHCGTASQRSNGKRLQDRYEIHIDDVLGQGSFGAVRVGQRRNGKGPKVAVKTIATAGMPARKIRKLHEEVSIMREADHPHIVQLLEVFYSPRGRVHLVMELCKGGTLYDYLDQFEDQHVDEARAASLLRQMLSAIGYLHDRGIVHCDIKLENWLCETKNGPTEDPPSLKLIDFGLSRHLDDTRRGLHEACGTIFYVAPEVLTEASGAGFGKQCDLWSTGVVAYMMLSGSPPFYGSTNGETKEQVLLANPSYSRRLFRHCNGGKHGLAVEFIKGLLTADPDQRLSAAEALVHPWLMEQGVSHPEVVAPLPEDTQSVADDESSICSSAMDGNRRRSLLTRRELVTSLRGFTELSNLTKLVCEVAAMTLRPDEIIELRDTFEAIDVDSSGTISFEELRNALVGNGTQPTSKDVARAFADEADVELEEMDLETLDAEIDKARRSQRRRITLPEEDINQIFDGISVSHDDKGVSYHEFLAAVMWRRVDLDENRLYEVFETLDTHGTGKLKLQDVAETCGQDFGNEALEAIQREINGDSGEDAYVTYEDLVQAWRKIVKNAHVHPLLEASVTGENS